MSGADIVNLVVGTLTGIISSSVFILALFIGFCIIVGFTKTKRTTGNAPVIKSLDEAVSRKAFDYLPPTAPRGHANPLKVW